MREDGTAQDRQPTEPAPGIHRPSPTPAERSATAPASAAGSLTHASSAVLAGAPLFPVAAGLILGIVWDHGWPSDAAYYWIVFVSAAGASIFGRVRRTAGPLLLCIAASAAAGLLNLSAVRTMPGSSIERLAEPQGRLLRVYGTVLSDPTVLEVPKEGFARWSFLPDRTAFLLRCRSVESHHGVLPVTGLVRVTVREALFDLRKHERVSVFGRLSPLRGPTNPGAFDWARYSRRQGIVADLYCDQRQNVARLDAEAPARAPTLLERARLAAHDLLTADIAAEAPHEASLLDAMILGQRSRLDRDLNRAFVQAGCVHFLAVSGVHVVIVMTLAQLACWPFMLTPRTRTWVMLVVVVAYVLLAEPRPPILRAGIIAVLYCIARLLGRQRAHLNWISASAVVLLLISPSSVFNVGWQLSFAAVLGVSYLTPAVVTVAKDAATAVRQRLSRHQIPDEELRRLQLGGGSPVARFAARGARDLVRAGLMALAVSIAAWLVAIPIIATHFNRAQLWGAPNSFLVYPLVTIVMGLGFAKLLLGAVWASAGVWIGQVLSAVDRALIDLVELLGMFPGSNLVTAAPPWWLLCVHYAFLVSVAGWAASRLGSRNRATQPESEVDEPPPRASRAARTAVTATGLALLAVAVAWAWPLGERPLTVTALDVGPGSATVIELPEGQTVLYDAGSLTRLNAGRSAVVPFLHSRGIRRIDRAYVSHANVDHFNGLLQVIDEVPVGTVYVNSFFETHSEPGSAGSFLLEALAERGQDVQVMNVENRNWQFGGASFELLFPLDTTLADEATPLSANESSTVLRISYAGHSVLLTGDIEDQTQRTLLQRGRLAADVLLLPHHGGVRPNSKAFIAAVDPDLAIRSSNQKMAETTNGLEHALGDVPVYNTADAGAVTVRIDQRGPRVSTFLPHATSLDD